MTRIFLAPLTVLVLFAAVPFTAACDTCCTYKKVVCYETVVTYETHVETYVKCITLYDNCGKPYVVEKTCTHEVQVPVKKVVPVVKSVKVCD
jgi:hypothetical protein